MRSLCRNGAGCRYLARNKCRFHHLDPLTESILATNPTTEEEKDQRRLAEEKRSEPVEKAAEDR